MEIARRRCTRRSEGRTWVAGDRTQIFVDRFDEIVTHILEYRPRHDLEKISVERRRQTTAGQGTYTCRMEMIEIGAGPDHLLKLRKREAARWPPGIIRSQVAADDVRVRDIGHQRTEIPAASQISRRIDLHRLVKVRVASRQELGLGAVVMATIAVGYGIHDIAAESDQCRIFSLQIERNRCNRKTDLDERFMVIAIRGSCLCLDTWRADPHPSENDGREGWRD